MDIVAEKNWGSIRNMSLWTDKVSECLSMDLTMETKGNVLFSVIPKNGSTSRERKIMKLVI